MSKGSSYFRDQPGRERIPAVAVLLLTMALVATGFAQDAGSEEEDMPGFTPKGADTCLKCHGGDEEGPHLARIFDGPHGVMADARTPFGGGSQCESCHGPGGEHAGRVGFGKERPPIPAFGKNALWSSQRENEICLSCHQGSAHRFWDGGAHETAGVNCKDCHTAHVRTDPILATSSEPDVCLSCHTQQRSEINRFSAHPVRQGQMACSDCHDAHGRPNEAMLSDMTINQSCYSCHAELRGPFLWEHAPVTEDCTQCHQPHGSNHPALLTRRAPLLCQQCHSRAGHPSVGRTGNDLPGNTSSVLGLAGSCTSCHSQVHGSNHPSGASLSR